MISARKASLRVTATRMTLPEDIYTQRILELAAATPRTTRLASPQASATTGAALRVDGGVVRSIG